jgi:cytochrome c-type biogenesis protein CcmF
MYYLVGTILLVAGAVLALMAGIGYILAIRGKRGALAYGRAGVYGSLFAISAMWVLLVTLFQTRRFDIEYVSMYSSTDLNTFFTIAATWAGQPGSLAIWVLFNAIIAALLVRRTRHFEPYVLAIYMLIQAGIVGLMLISNPFVPLTDPATGLAVMTPPADGQGLNPLLYNFWMIFHPPVLFVGYALAAVPIAFALGALLRYDYDGWITHALPWTIAAWVFLGLALLLGAYWSYETLGWGGYWGWDPVENSSLVPWLLLTALMHTMLVQYTHYSLRRTNIILAIVTFVSVMYATFLTRSGVLSNFSVHSFVSEGLSSIMIGFQLAIIVVSVVLLALRWRDIPNRKLDSAFFSRDSFMVLAVLTLVVIAVVTILGTSMPVISAIPGVGHTLQEVFGAAFELDDGSMLGGEPLTDGRFSLTPEFFNRTVPPLGIIMMILLVIGPLTSWRTTADSKNEILRGLIVPFVAAIFGTIIAIILGVRDAKGIAFIAISIFAAGTNILVALRHMRISWLHTGAQIAHLGLCLMIIGIVGSSMYATPDERVFMSAGEEVGIYDYTIMFHGWEGTKDKEGNPDGKGVLNLTVKRGDEQFAARPQLYFDQMTQSTMQTPAIRTYPLHDLYIAPAEYIPEDNPNKPVLQMGQSQKVGPYQITFDGFEVDEHSFQETGIAEVGAKLLVSYGDKVETVVPKINLSSESQTEPTDPNNPLAGFEQIPATLPDGHTVSLTMFDPTRRMVLLNITGLDLPTIPARAVITVSQKPVVLLVWIGSLVGILGGSIATIRRYSEGKMALQAVAVRLPKGMGVRQ